MQCTKCNIINCSQYVILLWGRIMFYISLSKVKYTEENVNFQKPIWIGGIAICFKLDRRIQICYITANLCAEKKKKNMKDYKNCIVKKKKFKTFVIFFQDNHVSMGFRRQKEDSEHWSAIGCFEVGQSIPNISHFYAITIPQFQDYGDNP